MTALFTPSAKSHERVTGRWVGDVGAETKPIDGWQRAAYCAKMAFGTPVPLLLSALTASVFLSRAAAEIAAWAVAGLTALYIVSDQFSRRREHGFFRVGGDFMLLGLFLTALASAAFPFSAAHPIESADGGLGDALATLGAFRWIPLIYLLAFAWELFPGLNRAYTIMSIAAATTAALAVWQAFSGLDIFGAKLQLAPLYSAGAATGGPRLYSAVGFFDSPEAMGTALAVFLPLPAMAFQLGRKREAARAVSFALALLIALAIFFTFRPGIWIAGGAGILVTWLMPGRRQWALALAATALIGTMMLGIGWSSDLGMQGVAQAQADRAAKQREQINQQLAIWSQAPWVGSGLQSVEAVRLDSTVGNVYFQILAQTGALGLSFFLLFCLGFLLGGYRILQEIPQTHYWHRALAAGGIAGLVAFHAAGLFWFTLSEALSANIFALLAATLAYLNEHYRRGLVPDDQSL